MFPDVSSPFIDIAPRSGILVWVSERVMILCIIIKLLLSVPCLPSSLVT